MRTLALLFASSLALALQNPLQEAVNQARLGHYREARAVLRDVQEPQGIAERIAFHRLKAAIASGLGEFQTAAAEMHAALRLSPSDANLTLATAVSELKANDLDAALRHVRASGTNPIALALRGDIEERRGNFDAAVDAYRQAANMAPGEERYRVALASELIRHQAFGTAIATLQQARSLFPSSARLLTLLGIAHYAAGDTREAIEMLTNATQFQPADPASYQCLSQIVLQNASAPTDDTLKALCKWNAVVCAALEVRKAREISDDALAQSAIRQLEHAPATNSVAHCALGRAYEWSEQLTEARRELETCVALDPSPQNHYALALLYRRLGESALARRQFIARDALLHQMSAETAAGLSALQAFTVASPTSEHQ